MQQRIERALPALLQEVVALLAAAAGLLDQRFPQRQVAVNKVFITVM